jgi:hypothetical protein
MDTDQTRWLSGMLQPLLRGWRHKRFPSVRPNDASDTVRAGFQTLPVRGREIFVLLRCTACPKKIHHPSL